MSSNYPDDIGQYKDDPRSPTFDDGGLEDAVAAKGTEIWDNLAEYKGELYERLIENLKPELFDEFILQALNGGKQSTPLIAAIYDAVNDWAEELVNGEAEDSRGEP